VWVPSSLAEELRSSYAPVPDRLQIHHRDRLYHHVVLLLRPFDRQIDLDPFSVVGRRRLFARRVWVTLDLCPLLSLRRRCALSVIAASRVGIYLTLAARGSRASMAWGTRTSSVTASVSIASVASSIITRRLQDVSSSSVVGVAAECTYGIIS
jgi:hypothetical protein